MSTQKNKAIDALNDKPKRKKAAPKIKVEPVKEVIAPAVVEQAPPVSAIQLTHQDQIDALKLSVQPEPEPDQEPEEPAPSRFAKVKSGIARAEAYIKSNWKIDLALIISSIAIGFIAALSTVKPKPQRSDLSYKVDSLERYIRQLDADKLDVSDFQDVMKQRNIQYKKENYETQSKIFNPGTTNDDKRKLGRELSDQK